MRKLKGIERIVFLTLPLMSVGFGGPTLKNYLLEFYQLVLQPASKTTGFITEAMRVDGADITVYNCKIKYEAAGTNYLLTSSISYDIYPNLKAGDPVHIRYLTANPLVSSVKTVMDLSFDFVISVFLFVWAAYAICYILKSLLRFFFRKKDSVSYAK